MIENRLSSRIIVSLIGALAVLAGPAFAQDQRMPTASQTKPRQSDPVPGTGADYPPSTATRDSAYVGSPKFVPQVNCSPSNPCAATSAPGGHK